MPPTDTSAPFRILVATDAWHPQVNGVVRTYERLADEVGALGAELVFLTPEDRFTLPLPSYPEIRLAPIGRRTVAETFDGAGASYLHIATEGPIGLAARRFARDRLMPFTTSFHTRFADYLSERLPVPLGWGYAAQRWFHNAGAGMLVSTPSLAEELAQRGFKNILAWTRGVDTDLYRPRADRQFGDGPVFLYVGRVAVEKNLDAFLSLDLPGKKVIVGAGPAHDELMRRYPSAVFTGPRFGEALARCYASADVFVFPSRTDTFGIVLLEAMASGVPVAAFPVTGPRDVVAPGLGGILSDDLGAAALQAMALDRGAVRGHALGFSWRQAARMFLDNVIRANAARGWCPGGALPTLIGPCED
ncbi:MAG: glycosyltransferase family 1 protein [Hyphomicrobiaceae bacterium]